MVFMRGYWSLDRVLTIVVMLWPVHKPQIAPICFTLRLEPAGPSGLAVPWLSEDGGWRGGVPARHSNARVSGRPS